MLANQALHAPVYYLRHVKTKNSWFLQQIFNSLYYKSSKNMPVF